MAGLQGDESSGLVTALSLRPFPRNQLDGQLDGQLLQINTAHSPWRSEPRNYASDREMSQPDISRHVAGAGSRKCAAMRATRSLALGVALSAEIVFSTRSTTQGVAPTGHGPRPLTQRGRNSSTSSVYNGRAPQLIRGMLAPGDSRHGLRGVITMALVALPPENKTIPPPLPCRKCLSMLPSMPCPSLRPWGIWDRPELQTDMHKNPSNSVPMT